jgi:hypothetical protein
MRVYRDSAGRTRREQQLTAPGFAPYPPPGGSMITINDPAADTSFMLDPNTETARRLPSFDVATTLVAAGTRMDRAPGLADAPPPGAPPELEAAPEHTGIQRTVEPGAVNVVGERFATQLPQPMPAGPARTAFFRAAPAVRGELDTRTEELGEQVLQGVRARGTRVMRTIPAGAIGNERAIEIVSETWYSPELEVDILRRHLDPRTGETVYALVSIDRSEPPADLFAVPSGYEIRNGPGAIDFELHREFEAPSAE